MKNNIKLHFFTAIGACFLSFPLLAMDKDERPDGGSMHHKPASAVSLAERSDASPASSSAAPAPAPSAAPPAVASAASVGRNGRVGSLASVPEDQSLRRIFIPAPTLKDLYASVKWQEFSALYTRTDTRVPALPHEYKATIRIPVASIKDAQWMGIWKSWGVHAAAHLPEFELQKDRPVACQGGELFCNFDNCQPAYGGYLSLQLRIMRVTGQGKNYEEMPFSFKTAKVVEDRFLGWGFEVEEPRL